jgi:putative peptidoglycan lipid II flippase
MSQMLKSTGAMGVATLTSRILGMLREMVYAGFMGDTPIAGAFKAALVVPNLFRRLLGEGALTAAFIPIFKDKEKSEGEAEMWKAANAVICGLLIAASVVVILVTIFLTLMLASDQPNVLGRTLFRVSATLFHRVPVLSPETRLMLELSRIMFPYMLLVCLAAVLMGMLNARGHFFIPAFGASILNLILIASVVLVAPRVGTTLQSQIFVLAYAVLVAGAAQAVYQMPTLYADGFRFRWINPFGHPVVKRVIRQMIPGMMGVAAFQLNMLSTYGLAFWVDPSMIASFDYAVRLMEFPQGMFGVSLATYLLPTLSGLAAEKKFPEFRATYKQAVGYLFFVNLIASVLLFVLAVPMIRLLFEHGKFTGYSTNRSAFALMFLGPGLLAFSMVNITARAFYALGDTQTPMRISTVCLLLNIVFALFLIPPLAQGGMALANTMSACFNVYFLMFGLRKKLSRLDIADLRPLLLNMLGAAVFAGIVAWALYRLWDGKVGNSNLFARVGGVFVPLGGASLVYIGLCLWMKIPQADDVRRMLLRPWAGK